MTENNLRHCSHLFGVAFCLYESGGWTVLMVTRVVDALSMVSVGAFIRYLRFNLLTNRVLGYETVRAIVRARSHPSRSRLIVGTDVYH